MGEKIKSSVPYETEETHCMDGDMGVKAINGERRGAKEQGASSGFETLVRKLVAHARQATPAQPGQPPSGRDKEAKEEVLFDCEVDGVRCVLARAPHAADETLSLSPREQEIVRMVADGHPNKVIAGVLNISPWTVGTHLRRIFAKLGVSSRAALVSHLLEIRASRGNRFPGR